MERCSYRAASQPLVVKPSTPDHRAGSFASIRSAQSVHVVIALSIVLILTSWPEAMSEKQSNARLSPGPSPGDLTILWIANCVKA